MAVEHRKAEHRFAMVVPEGTAVLDYRMHDGGVMEMTHTFTPSQARGRGVARQVVMAAFEYARANKLKVIPACWYAAQFAMKHPEFGDVLVEDDAAGGRLPACEI